MMNYYCLAKSNKKVFPLKFVVTLCDYKPVMSLALSVHPDLSFFTVIN